MTTLYDGAGNAIEVSGGSSGNVLHGKKWACCGDSVTMGVDDVRDAQGNYLTYEYYIATRNNMTLYKDGISGSVMGLTRKYLEGQEEIGFKWPFAYQRYLSVPLDCDYVTIWFGINDSALYNDPADGQNYNYVTLGTINDTTNETFYGAWNVVLSYLIEHMPNAHIGLVVSHRTTATYCTAVRDVAKKHGLKVFDIPNDPYIPYWSWDSANYANVAMDIANQRQTDWWVNISHPNAAGYEYISYAFENWMRSL